VRPDETFSRQYPKALNTRITIRCTDGRVLSKEHVGFEGGLENPLSWERVVEKFHWLSEQHAEQSLRDEIVHMVSNLESHSIRELMALMTSVSTAKRFPVTHPGIQ
jgi:2-methylcitrate dehydratase